MADKLHHDTEGYFVFPDSVSSLDEVPEEFHESYQIDTGPDGGAFLTDEARRMRDDFNAEIAELRRSFDVQKQTITAESEQARATTVRTRIDTALQAALTAAGVKSQLQRGAVALLREEYEFDLELSEFGDHTVFARTPAGIFSLSDVVASFLDMPDGEGFRPANRMQPAGGTFSAMLGAIGKKM